MGSTLHLPVSSSYWTQEQAQICHLFAANSIYVDLFSCLCYTYCKYVQIGLLQILGTTCTYFEHLESFSKLLKNLIRARNNAAAGRKVEDSAESVLLVEDSAMLGSI